MRFARFKHSGRIAYGMVDGSGIQEISSTPFLPFELTGQTYGLDEVRLLAPCVPSKVVGVALNYADHIEEMGKQTPDHPVFFYKPSTAVVGPGGTVAAPPGCEQLDYEGELSVVIGSVARSVPPARASEVILGYTVGIDATARDFQAQDMQWGRAKGFDSSAPLGPWIETELDPSDLALTTRLNGEIKQESRTSQMVFSTGVLVAFVTRYITLLPGDVIMTGTPAGIGPMADGDRCSVEIEGIGELEVSVKGPAE